MKTLSHDDNLKRKTFDRSILRIIALVSITCTLMVFFVYLQTKFIRQKSDHLRGLNETFVKFVEIEKLHLNMETGFRGFKLNGGEEFLAPYNEAKKLRRSQVEEVFKALPSGYGLAKALRSVDEDFKQWHAFAEKAIEARIEKNGSQRDSTQEGKSLFDNIRASSEIFKSNLKKEITDYRQNLKSTENYTTFTLFAILVFFVVGLILMLISEMKRLTLRYRDLLKQNSNNFKKLEEASSSKDLFLANMSHEIRTPLGAVIGFSDLLVKDEALAGSSSAKSYVNFIQRNSKHLLTLVNDLFDISKIVAHKIDIQSEKVFTNQLVTDLKNFFASVTNDKKIQLDFLVPGGFPEYFHSDETRLKQVLTNLIGNAIKFTPRSGLVKVLFSYENDLLLVDVIDQGIGIAEAKQKKIFDPFSQSDESHSRDYGGAGLGLAISSQLAELIGGKLDLISSTLKVGSHFRLTVTLEGEVSKTSVSEATLEESSIDVNGYDGADMVSYNFVGKKILLAEDSKENQILLGIYLHSTGATVDMVDNGADAIRKVLEKRDYDLILMDIQMPGMDGYEAVKILRDSNYRGYVLALTAHAMKGEKKKCLSFGFDDYLSKPVTQPVLLRKIHSLLTLSAQDSEHHSNPVP